MSTNVDGFSFNLDGVQWLNNVYDTPVVLAQLGECGVCDLPGAHSLSIQPANSSDTKVHSTLSPLSCRHTWRHGSQPRWNDVHTSDHLYSDGTHPGMPRIVMCAMWGDKVSSQQLYTSDGVDLLCQEQCSRAPSEGRAVMWRWIAEEIEQHSQDISEVFKGVNSSRMLTVITTTQTNTVKGSRL